MLARREGKTPVIALAEKGRPGLWLLIKAEDLQDVAAEMARAMDSTAAGVDTHFF